MNGRIIYLGGNLYYVWPNAPYGVAKVAICQGFDITGSVKFMYRGK